MLAVIYIWYATELIKSVKIAYCFSFTSAQSELAVKPSITKIMMLLLAIYISFVLKKKVQQ